MIHHESFHQGFSFPLFFFSRRRAQRGSDFTNCCCLKLQGDWTVYKGRATETSRAPPPQVFKMKALARSNEIMENHFGEGIKFNEQQSLLIKLWKFTGASLLLRLVCCVSMFGRLFLLSWTLYDNWECVWILLSILCMSLTFFFFYLRASHESTGWANNHSFPTKNQI